MLTSTNNLTTNNQHHTTNNHISNHMKTTLQTTIHLKATYTTGIHVWLPGVGVVVTGIIPVASTRTPANQTHQNNHQQPSTISIHQHLPSVKVTSSFTSLGFHKVSIPPRYIHRHLTFLPDICLRYTSLSVLRCEDYILPDIYGSKVTLWTSVLIFGRLEYGIEGWVRWAVLDPR